MVKSQIKFIDRLCAEPYRIFFPTGIILGLAGTGHWLAYGLGWLKSYSLLFHSFTQTQGYVSAFIIGFLMTAFPRLSGAKSAGKAECLSMFFTFLAASAACTVYSWKWSQFLFAAVLLQMMLFILRRIKRAAAEPAVPLPASGGAAAEMLWVPIAFLCALLGTALFLLGINRLLPAFFMQWGRLLSTQGFVLAVVLGVGGFLGPRLMGTFRPYPAFSSPGALGAKKKREAILHSALAVLLFLSFFLETARREQWAFLIRALLVTWVYARSGALTLRPKNTDAYIPFLWLSFWLLTCGSWSLFFFPAFRSTLVHFVFIGGYSLMIFAVASMVIYNHAGQGALLRKKDFFFGFCGACLIAALAARLSAPLFPKQYFAFVAAAAFLWCLPHLLWLGKLSPFFFRFSDDETLRREHEAAKARILNSRVPTCTETACGEP